MKLHMEWSLKRSQSTRPAAPANELRQRVGGVLAESLGVLGERLGTSFRGRDARSDKVGMSRLREVLDRDRALLAANPEERGLDDVEFGRVPSVAPQVTTLTPQVATLAPQVATLTPQVTTLPPQVTSLAAPLPAAAQADAFTLLVEPEIDAPAPSLLVVPTAENVAPVSSTVVVSPTVVICREPIRTRTMARLLASQGHRERALSIYDHLLARSPDDEGLRVEADALRGPDA